MGTAAWAYSQPWRRGLLTGHGMGTAAWAHSRQWTRAGLLTGHGMGTAAYLVFMSLTSVTAPFCAKCSRSRCSVRCFGRFFTIMRDVL